MTSDLMYRKCVCVCMRVCMCMCVPACVCIWWEYGNQNSGEVMVLWFVFSVSPRKEHKERAGWSLSLLCYLSFQNEFERSITYTLAVVRVPPHPHPPPFRWLKFQFKCYLRPGSVVRACNAGPLGGWCRKTAWGQEFKTTLGNIVRSYLY